MKSSIIPPSEPPPVESELKVRPVPLPRLKKPNNIYETRYDVPAVRTQPTAPPRPPAPNFYYNQKSKIIDNPHHSGATLRQMSLPAIARPRPQIYGTLPRPSRTPQVEPLYMEIEDAQYLVILPPEDDVTVRKPAQVTSPTSKGVYNQIDSCEQYYEIIEEKEDVQEIQELLKWMRQESKAAHKNPSVFGLDIKQEIRSFNQRAMTIRRALHLYDVLMKRRSRSLWYYVTEFRSISQLLDKDEKKMKNLGIAGGTTGAVGGVAAVVGIALAPVTMGVSLVATAVGVGMVGAAGGIGVHAATPNKEINDQEKIEKLACDYAMSVTDIERCLGLILFEVNELQRHDLGRLEHAEGVLPAALTLAHRSQAVTNNIHNGRISSYASTMPSERLLHAFAAEMDQYYKDKGGHKKLRKSNKSRLSGRVQLLVRNLQEELDYLNDMWKCFNQSINQS
ncbi:uncharacterized protein LOC133541289 isoform X2 [Nerophis ophidion]|uniref:uncharacterized protein LOC133541289 isoform X2 n=1 Tax=Nerophis ophidion TaxID=159077 RepID=UPI002AE08B7E|nr:uncharacterized protein LOC133541289 isoform X2 [Nerophis ophidion]